ncbi:MAG: KOW motif-containing protein, partial [Clostridia bacterium]|nr:KOW motif-containing protein [Clostridia bacterium]
NITGVTGFVGPGSTPVPISDEEVERIGVITEKQAATLPYGVGDSVKITSGPLANFVGTVQSISDDMKKVSVLASVFGRETPVELDFDQLEPVK